MSVASARQGADPAYKSVCIVDDDPGVTDSLKLLLETFGFAVQSYSSGAQFLADDCRRTAGCLVVDLHMPGMNGLDVVDQLQREGVRLPTILISGRLDTAARQRAANLGVTEVVEKPFLAMCMVDLIRASLSEL
jgi:two-component system, LuxR family, response regulator FixJ